MQPNSAVITDIDNTLYNFVDVFAPAFRAMVHTIARKTRLDEDIIVESFRAVYARRHSLEYSFAVQELPVLRDLNLPRDVLHREIVYPAWVAFGQSRRSRLKPYPHVPETLRWLRRQGYTLIAYTDGAYGRAASRLRQLGIGGYFDYVVSWGPELADPHEPIDSFIKDPGHWFVNAGVGSPKVVDSREAVLDINERKPNPRLLGQLVEKLHIDTETSWIVGDSPAKDLEPGRAIGITDVWARYGKRYEERNWATLVSLSPWRATEISREATGLSEFVPSYAIDSFNELEQLVLPMQQSLFS